MKKNEGLPAREENSSSRKKPEDMSFGDLADFVQEVKDQALQTIDKKFENLLRRVERDFNGVLKKYEDNLIKIEARRAETRDEEQAEHDREYARQILAEDTENIKNEIRRNLPS